MNWGSGLLFLGSIICLIGIGYQDFKYFAISWGWLPLLAFLSIFEGVNLLPFHVLIQDYAMSLIFVITQLSLITFWFSLKEKKLVNISLGVLGLGDILFLLVLVFSFSFINYLVFVIVSIFFIALVYYFLQKILMLKEKRIPLAGGMALSLVVVKLLSIFGFITNLYSNQYLWVK